MKTAGNTCLHCFSIALLISLCNSGIYAQSVRDLNQVKNTSYQIFVDKETGILYNIDQADSLSKIIPLNLFSVDIENDTATFQITLGEIKSEKDLTEFINQPLKFNITDLNGNEYSSEELRGKVVVFNFWFTSCKPCIEEMPILNEIVDQYKNNDVVFFALSYESPDVLKKFLLKRPFNYSVFPNSSELIEQLYINSYPTHVILDKSGIIRFVETGFIKDQKTGEPEIKSLLEKQINTYL